MATAEVILWNRVIGAVSDDNGYIEFSYNPDFIGAGIELAPLAMPVNSAVYSFPELRDERPYYGLPGMLADSLPDSYGNLMIKEYLGRYGSGRTELSPIEKLCYTGVRGMGALEYKPILVEANRCENINLSELNLLAEAILTQRDDLHITESETAMQQLLQVGSSAGGARAKALIAWNEETGEIRSGQIDAGEGYGYWLLKFDRITNNKDRELQPDDVDSTRLEYAYYLMAKDAGLDMTESRLYHDGECAHFITKRFDRVDGGKKLHMVSLCGMAHMNFTQRHVYGYENVADVVDRVGLGKMATEKIFRRMVFGDMTYNFDDHVKNTSFLMNKKGEWSLAPAYDVAFAYDPNGKWTNSHQMLINGKAFDITQNDYFECGKHMGLKEAKMQQIVEQVRNAIKDFMIYAEKSGVREERMEYVKRLIDRKIL